MYVVMRYEGMMGNVYIAGANLWVLVLGEVGEIYDCLSRANNCSPLCHLPISLVPVTAEFKPTR